MTDHQIYLKYPDDDRKAWQAGMSYPGLHVYYMAPMSQCECDVCDRGRLWEACEEHLLEHCDPFWQWYKNLWKLQELRPL